MNIFEQYGIKEVADCTLYSIALDKHDDEVYIPILYFDTLKVSTIEQTAEQTSAKGGLGNPDLITWDYGKEITLNLEDALYNPASQSLMWSGRFGAGKAKIWGLWDYVEYDKDEKTGAINYITRLVAYKNKGKWVRKDKDGNEVDVTGIDENNADITKKNGWIKFTCPCDNENKYMKFEVNSGKYKYQNTDFVDGYIKDAMKVPAGRNLEIAYITLENFGDFKYNIQDSEFKYENKCRKNLEGLMKKDCSPVSETDPTYIEYTWLDCDIRMVSMGKRVSADDDFTKDGDTFFLEHGNVAYTMNRLGGLEQIGLSRDGIYKAASTVGTETDTESPDYYRYVDSYNDDKHIISSGKNGSPTIYEWKKSEETAFSSLITENGISQEHQRTGRALHFYKNVTQIIEDESGTDLVYQVRVPVGTFYLCELKDVTDRAGNNFDFYSTSSWYSTSPYEMIYPIDSGLEDVPYLDRMEKCKATNTFAIDVDRNMVMSQYKDLQKYQQTPLTVYIDPKTMKPYEPNSTCFHKQNGVEIKGNLRIIKQHEIYYKWTRSVAPKDMSLGYQIVVDATHFPGTYRLVGETYSRARKDGKDQRLQFEIPLCKMSSDTNLTLEAAGDPTTFSMTMKVMRRDDGVMMKLTQYNVTNSKYNGVCSGSTEIVPIDGVMPKIPEFGGG